MPDEPRRLAQHGGQRVKGAQSVRHYGTSKSYLVDRLRRENLTSLAEAVERGRVSAYAVATRLGWITRHPITGTGSENQARRRRHQLDTLMREGYFDARQRG